MPIELLVQTYEKLLQLDRKASEMRAFAVYLEAHSSPHPEEEWQIRARQLEQEAELLENGSKG